MKKILKPLFCAAALVLLAGCNKFDEANATPETSNGSLIKVYANVAENDGTRANINVGESVFTAEWEAGDALGILPVKTGGTAPATAAKFNYNTASAAFEGSLNDFVAGGGNYYAFFPHAQVTGTTANLPFGNLRTQTGNDFNSAYDALVATPQAYGAADEAGKVDGNPVAFTLHRLTSILDFSIATQADKVKYLLLTAGGETQKLSASSLDFALENGGAETAVTLSTTDQSNVIALQYTPDGASADKVEAGEEAPADFTKRLYKGEETFTVKPGETTNVAVVCQIVNTVVEVKFDDSILQNLAPGYSVWIAGGEKVDEQAAEAGSVPALRFTTEGTGYYTLPAGMTSLAWLFRGTHVEGKNVEMEDYIPNVKAGGKYTLTFKYSPDLLGYIDCVLISVDPGTDDKDDEIIFSPDPAVISEGFDITEIQKYRSGEKKYRIMAFSELTRFTVSVGDKSYDALNGTTEGISLEPVDKYNVRLTLSDAFFASCQAGDQKVTLRIEDANGGSSEVATTYRLEGLVPVTADDYDLWANTVTLRVVSFTPGTTVQFGLRSSGGEWQPMAGTSQGDDFITATYAPQWEEKTTADWSTPATVLPYSRLKKGTGISAGNTYDYKATVGSKELSGRFTADEGAPMTDGSLESWRSAQQFPGSGTNYTFWGSGYNPFAKELCTRDEAMPGRVGTYCAKLSATYNTLAKVPAPGNLFTGDFAIQVLGGMGGNVSFGKKFAYNARPRAVRFKYHATIGEVNYNLHGGKIPVGEMDKARIFVCIVDWTAQQKVFAGTKAPTGTWDPETQTEAANGPIIGYASKFIEETTQGDEMVEVILPINYYQDTAAAPDGKYNIVVSCSTSAYGDYMDACTTNVMYVDDFEWVY